MEPASLSLIDLMVTEMENISPLFAATFTACEKANIAEAAQVAYERIMIQDLCKKIEGQILEWFYQTKKFNV